MKDIQHAREMIDTIHEAIEKNNRFGEEIH